MTRNENERVFSLCCVKNVKKCMRVPTKLFIKFAIIIDIAFETWAILMNVHANVDSVCRKNRRNQPIFLFYLPF